MANGLNLSRTKSIIINLRNPEAGDEHWRLHQVSIASTTDCGRPNLIESGTIEPTPPCLAYTTVCSSTLSLSVYVGLGAVYVPSLCLHFDAESWQVPLAAATTFET